MEMPGWGRPQTFYNHIKIEVQILYPTLCDLSKLNNFPEPVSLSLNGYDNGNQFITLLQ